MRILQAGAIFLVAAALTGCGGGNEARPEAATTSTVARPSIVDGVRLTTSVPSLVKRACDQAQTEVSVGIVCPELVPKGPLVTEEGLWGPIVFSRDLWLITFNNGDNGPRYLHWMVGVGRWPAVRHYLLSDAVNEVKGLPTRIDRESLEGRTVLTFSYPDFPAGGPNGGHVAAFVACGEQAVIASLHGRAHRHAAREIALALAEQANCPES